MPSKSWVLLSALLVVSCVSPAQHGEVAPVEVTRAKRAVPQAVVSGVLTAPSHLIGNNSSGLVGNNGGNLLGNNGGNWRVLAIDESPVPGAEVYLADAGGRPIAKLPAVETDAEGRFSIKGVPAGFTFVLMGAFKNAEGEIIRLQTVVTSGKSQKSATISLASTLVTQAAIEKSAGLLGELDPDSLETSIIALAAELTAADAMLAADREAARARVEELTRTNQQLQEALAALEQKLATGGPSTEALQELEEKLDAIQEDTTPTPTPTPTRAASTPTPTPVATATPTAAPTATPAATGDVRLATQLGLPGDAVSIQGLSAEAMFLPIKVTFTGAAPLTAFPFMGLMGVTVPTGATSGPVTVQVATGPVKQAGQFQVLRIVSETRLTEEPGPVAVDPQGHAWVGSVGLGEAVFRVAPTGQLAFTREVGGEVGGLAFDAGGTAWVANDSGVTLLTPAGELVATIPSSEEPYGIARDREGGIWVADHDGRLSRLTAEGAIKQSYATGAHAHGLAIASDGAFWVADNDRSRVIKLSATGAKLGEFPVGPAPEAVLVDRQGSVWVSNSGAKTVSKLSAGGEALGTFTVGNQPMGLALDDSGRVWVACEGNDTVVVLAPDGAQLGVIKKVRGPVGLAAGSDRRMWVTSSDTRKLFQLQY